MMMILRNCTKNENFSKEGRTIKMSGGFLGEGWYVLSCLDMNREKNVFITQNGNLEVQWPPDPITFPLEEGARNPTEAQ